MSEEPTQDLTQKYDTKPTIETVLSEVRAGFARMEERFVALETRSERMALHLERVTSVVHETRAEMLELRMEFRERFKEPA